MPSVAADRFRASISPWARAQVVSCSRPGRAGGIPRHIAIRDSKTPNRATLSFPAEAVTAFVEALKQHRHP